MIDRLFWGILPRLWPGWREALVIVKPETVIGWHRKGFRRSRTERYEDAAIEKNWKMGTNRPCRLIVTLESGAKLEKLVEISKGDPANPLTREELGDKFRDRAQLCFDAPRTGTIIAALEGIDRLDKISELTGLIAKN